MTLASSLVRPRFRSLMLARSNTVATSSTVPTALKTSRELGRLGPPGHHHNNDLDEFPFVFYDEERMNVGVEILGYQPIQLDTIVDILEEAAPGTHLQTRADQRMYSLLMTNDR